MAEVNSRVLRTAESADAIVDAGGRGHYRTVQEAIDAAPQSLTAERRWVIFVRAGVYRETVYVQREKRFVALVGEDAAGTAITNGLHAAMPGPDGRPIGTFRTPTLTIDADDVDVENLTIENDAGPVSQALALRVDGDRVVVRDARVIGWHDTLLLNRGRQYFEHTYIAGHLDFIFGAATTFFSRCHLHVRRDGCITAASTPSESRRGFVFDECRITGETPETRAYLGRPWRDFARVAFLRTDMGAVVRPEGWHNSDRPAREKTARFEEFANRGPGATPEARVPWITSLTATDATRLFRSNEHLLFK